MAIDDGSIDECGTGRYTPPPLYKKLLHQKQTPAEIRAKEQKIISQRQERHAANATNLSPMIMGNSQTNPYELDYDKNEEYYQITMNTRKSAESLEEIRSIMTHQEIVLNLLLTIGLAITFIVIVIYCWYYHPGPYVSKEQYSVALNKLNLTDEARQIIIDMAEKSALFKLKKCIMTNLG